MEPLKNIYNEAYVDRLTSDLQTTFPDFVAEDFRTLILQPDWSSLELMERKRRITEALCKTLPDPYTKALEILVQVAPPYNGLGGIVFPDFVQCYGLDYWNESMDALEVLTQYSTAEFAVRPYFIKDTESMIKQCLVWADSSNEHVRRLASEGSRPRLPWGISVPSFKQDPTPLLPILEKLKQDESLYVRRSVANSLNDITKTHPDLFIQIAMDWYGGNEDTNWIIKHASRSLLKKGDKQILSLFGYENSQNLHIKEFQFETASIKIGERVDFSFDLFSEVDTKLRVEYAIDYVKARGHRTRKVFKLSETSIKEKETKPYSRTHAFEDLSTRTHHPGLHQLTLIVNGEEKVSVEFEVG
ncbi:DNA alkylation repair protein [Alkalicoccobacillus murimartini]|uniref:3-methyladenine DNA glycosylase AlkC n=1 Tax=Alkalicoccobacillus murimartini TaxID=171685 RepID=A0ABT9YK71_9BACI|nr:DNA alkylation repair protein [Alkalicoccobacillus murimartini]MDQ0207612.1 3-methyladenine DNA glycosylase AlkC [Alkalicoccobacillus murimartini]